MASEVGQMMKFAHIVDEVFAGHVEHLARAHNAAELLALSVNVQRLSSLIQHSKVTHLLRPVPGPGDEFSPILHRWIDFLLDHLDDEESLHALHAIQCLGVTLRAVFLRRMTQFAPEVLDLLCGLDRADEVLSRLVTRLTHCAGEVARGVQFREWALSALLQLVAASAAPDLNVLYEPCHLHHHTLLLTLVGVAAERGAPARLVATAFTLLCFLMQHRKRERVNPFPPAVFSRAHVALARAWAPMVGADEHSIGVPGADAENHARFTLALARGTRVLSAAVNAVHSAASENAARERSSAQAWGAFGAQTLASSLHRAAGPLRAWLPTMVSSTLDAWEEEARRAGQALAASLGPLGNAASHLQATRPAHAVSTPTAHGGHGDGLLSVQSRLHAVYATQKVSPTPAFPPLASARALASVRVTAALLLAYQVFAHPGEERGIALAHVLAVPSWSSGPGHSDRDRHARDTASRGSSGGGAGGDGEAGEVRGLSGERADPRDGLGGGGAGAKAAAAHSPAQRRYGRYLSDFDRRLLEGRLRLGTEGEGGGGGGGGAAAAASRPQRTLDSAASAARVDGALTLRVEWLHGDVPRSARRRVPTAAPEVLRQLVPLVSYVLQDACTGILQTPQPGADASPDIPPVRGRFGTDRALCLCRLALVLLQCLAEHGLCSVVLHARSLEGPAGRVFVYERDGSIVRRQQSAPMLPLACTLYRLLAHFLSVHVANTVHVPTYRKVMDVMHRLLYFDCYRKHPSAGLSTRLAPWPYMWGALVGVIRALAGRHAVEFQRQPAQTVALGMQILQFINMALPRVTDDHLVSLFYELLRHDAAFRRWRHLMLEQEGEGIPPQRQLKQAMENLNRVISHLSTKVELAAGGNVAALTSGRVEQIVRDAMPEVDLEPHDPARDVFNGYAEHPEEDLLLRQIMRALSQDVKASATFEARA